jgi:prepilin-type N-terminal cleavage/methylation domain-containing protein
MIKSNKKSAFTLVELMIVIAIIGILAAIVSYNYSRIKAKVARKTCLANMKLIFEASQEYLMEHTTLPNTVHKLDVTELVKAGYLNKRPRCPIATNRYSITMEEKGKIKVKCFNPHNPKAGHGEFMYNDK